MNGKTYSPILELRMYTLRKGRRDEMIELFDRELIEPREEVGIQIIGQFRDVDNPKRWTWLQGFDDMQSRAEALNAFYTSPAWKANAKAANATIVDSGNVLLLHPAKPDSGFKLKAGKRPPRGSTTPQDGFVEATIYYFDKPVEEEFIEFFETKMQPILKTCGANLLGYFVTEESPNSYPRLAIREGEHVFVWLAGFPESEAHEGWMQRLKESKAWSEVQTSIKKFIKGETESMRLTPTPRSRLTGV